MASRHSDYDDIAALASELSLAKGCRHGTIAIPHLYPLSACGLLISSPVFGRHIILRDFMRINFSDAAVRCIFHSADRFGLERLPLLDEFQHTQRACLRDIR
jgi:hypothetical protein